MFLIPIGTTYSKKKGLVLLVLMAGFFVSSLRFASPHCTLALVKKEGGKMWLLDR